MSERVSECWPECWRPAAPVGREAFGEGARGLPASAPLPSSGHLGSPQGRHPSAVHPSPGASWPAAARAETPPRIPLFCAGAWIPDPTGLGLAGGPGSEVWRLGHQGPRWGEASSRTPRGAAPQLRACRPHPTSAHGALDPLSISGTLFWVGCLGALGGCPLGGFPRLSAAGSQGGGVGLTPRALDRAWTRWGW